MSYIAALRALLTPSGRAKAPAAGTIAKALAEARAEQEAATIEISKLQAGRLLALLDAAERAKHSAALAAARQRAEDAALAAEELQRRLAEAEDAEREAERRRRYADAKAKRDKLAGEFGPRYNGYVTGLVELLREVAETDRLVDEANDDLPEDAEPLPSVEAVRDRPGLQRRVLRKDTVSLWASPYGDEPLPGEMQAVVKTSHNNPNEGYITNHNKAQNVVSTNIYVRKKFEQVVYLESTVGETGPRLHRMTLPALHVDEPALYEPRPFPMEPGDVLRAIERAASQPVASQGRERREQRIEFRLISDEPPAAPPVRTVPPSQRVLDVGQSAL